MASPKGSEEDATGMLVVAGMPKRSPVVVVVVAAGV